MTGKCTFLSGDDRDIVIWRRQSVQADSFPWETAWGDVVVLLVATEASGMRGEHNGASLDGSKKAGKTKRARSPRFVPVAVAAGVSAPAPIEIERDGTTIRLRGDVDSDTLVGRESFRTALRFRARTHMPRSRGC